MAVVGMGLHTFSSFRNRNAQRRAGYILRKDCDMHSAKHFPDSLAFHRFLPTWNSFVVSASQKRVGIFKMVLFTESLCALTLPEDVPVDPHGS